MHSDCVREINEARREIQLFSAIEFIGNDCSQFEGNESSYFEK